MLGSYEVAVDDRAVELLQPADTGTGLSNGGRVKTLALCAADVGAQDDEDFVNNWARFWAVDLHVHTPGSSDAKAENYGTADDIVNAAIAVGLDAIAVTDHNTSSWCATVAAAAVGTDLIVLPGVEISTTEGHLLAIWEEGTPAEVIRDLLVALDIKSSDQGKLEVAAKRNLAESAQKVTEYGGIAIPAHVDKSRGLLGIAVKDHLLDTLRDPAIAAVEIVKRETAAKEVEPRIQGHRILACVQGSDTWDAAQSCHALSGIGSRRTWVKASRPDLVGLKHALADPELRLRLDAPPGRVNYPVIERVSFQGGFMDGQVVDLAPDLNCLLGGTGTGKSLILESVRFVLDQQVNADRFPAIAKEVHDRLSAALSETGVVIIQVRDGDQTYRIERVYGRDGSSGANVLQLVGTEWAVIDVNPRDIVEIAAFSQGEVLEYAREAVGRMSLVDAGLDLGDVEERLSATDRKLRQNGLDLIAARGRIDGLRDVAAQSGDVEEQVRQLSAFFDTAVVKAQGGWKTEGTRLKNLRSAVAGLPIPTVRPPAPTGDHVVAENADLFMEVKRVLDSLSAEVAAAVGAIEAAKLESLTALTALESQWAARFTGFKKELDTELETVKPGESMVALRARLEELQAKSEEAKGAKTELETEAQPHLDELNQEREALLEELQQLRHSRREMRRARVAELNKKMAGQVRIDVPSVGDFAHFRAQLEIIKVGSQVKAPVLDAIAQYVHPLRFARALWNADVTELVNIEHGIDATSVARLLSNIADRGLWGDLLEAQLIERPDLLTVSFKKPGSSSYTSIEHLAHGQKCTAILIILLADGVTPVLVDQPEDALHAPWIEEYLVERLRSLRGSRQYVFPTRSPGIVVSGDAEQIVTLSATAGKSEVEASGSLERHDLNRLALHHLEGGPVPFRRRTRKLASSTTEPV